MAILRVADTLNTIINMYSVFWEEGEAFNHFTSLQVNKISCEQRHFVIG